MFLGFHYQKTSISSVELVHKSYELRHPFHQICNLLVRSIDNNLLFDGSITSFVKYRYCSDGSILYFVLFIYNSSGLLLVG